MYVNIKILAAFPWFQALNILVILTLSHRQKRTAAPQENLGCPTEKRPLRSPSPASSPVPPANSEFAASEPIKSSLALMLATRILLFRSQGTAGRHTGVGLDMYVVFNSTPPLPYAIHAGDRERPLNKLTSIWCGSHLAAAGGWLMSPDSLSWPVGRETNNGKM